MDKKPIVGFDVDDVVLNLMPNWLKYYNEEFNDNVKKEDIIEWNMTPFIKPEAKDRIFEYIEEENIFRTAEPVEDAVESILEIMSWNNCRIIYITAGDPNRVKFNWLTDRGILTDKDNFVACYDKSLVRGISLLDDKYSSVNTFLGKGYLFDQPWNRSFKFSNRIHSWKQYMERIREDLNEAR